MKFRNKLVYKITFAILFPIIIISIILSVVLYQNISTQKEEVFTNDLAKVVFNYIEYLDRTLDNISFNARKDAIFIENSNRLIGEELLQITTNNLLIDSIIFGSGIFFDESMYDKQEKVAFYYSYHKGEKIVQVEVDDINDKYFFNYIEVNPEWWSIPSAKHKSGWTKPYYDTLSGHVKIVTYYQPFFYGDQFAGVVTIDISLARLEKWLTANEKQLEKDLDASIYLISRDSTTIYIDNTNHIGLNVYDTIDSYPKKYNIKESLKVIDSAIAGKTGNTIVKSHDGSKLSIAFYAPLHHTNWTAISVISYSVIQNEVYKALSNTLLIIFGIITILIIMIILIAKYISTPIIKLSRSSIKIAEGDYTTKIINNSNDEIGTLADNFNLMTEKLNEREKNLKSANKKLLVLDEAKNDFLKLISHEIRTPLNGIVGSAYFLNDMIDDPELRDFLDMLKESVDRLDKFSKTALEITQMQTVGKDIRKTNFSVNSIIEKILTANTSIANEKQIVISVTYSEEDEIIGIEDYFNRAIEELIGNAIKFANNNTVIKIKTYVEDEKLKISVTDKGEVIPREKIKDIIKPFGLGNEHYDKNIGLGLTYIQAFLDIHDALMEIVSSEEETVITLVFNLP